MTKKKEKVNDFVSNWMSEIKAGERYREKYSSYSMWKEYKEYYRGNWKAGVIPVNRVFSFGRSLIPQIYFRNPRVNITPTRPNLVLQARVLEQLSNWLIKECLLKDTMKMAGLYGYLTGIGAIKLGFDSEYGYIPTQVVDDDSSTVTQTGRREERLIEYRTNIKPGMPWALPVQADSLITPMGYQDSNSLPWVGHYILRPLEDVRQDQKYTDTEELKGTRRADIQKTERSIFTKDDSIKLCELYEIRDAQRGRIITLSENKVLLDSEDALQIDGLPWEFLMFNPDPDHFWPISDVKILEPQQLELNETRTQAQSHRRIALLKFLVAKGCMTPAEKDRLLSGDVGPLVEVDIETIGSLTNAIFLLQPHIPPDLQMAAQEILRDLQLSMGFSENQEGSFRRGTPPTATETMTVQQSFDARVEERKDIMADVFTKIIRKFHQYIFRFWTKERVARITGPDGMQYWVQYTGEQLQGEYDYLVDVESGFPISRAMRMQFGDGLMKQYGGDTLIDQIRLRQFHLQQYEWIMPGVSSLVYTKDPLLAAQEANARQPSPGGASGAGNPPGENQGGGRSGSSPKQPMEMEQMKEMFRQGGK